MNTYQNNLIAHARGYLTSALGNIQEATGAIPPPEMNRETWRELIKSSDQIMAALGQIDFALRQEN